MRAGRAGGEPGQRALVRHPSAVAGDVGRPAIAREEEGSGFSRRAVNLAVDPAVDNHAGKAPAGMRASHAPLPPADPNQVARDGYVGLIVLHLLPLPRRGDIAQSATLALNRPAGGALRL